MGYLCPKSCIFEGAAWAVKRDAISSNDIFFVSAPGVPTPTNRDA